MSINQLRNGSVVITFAVNADGTVTVSDNLPDAIPYTMSAEDARTEWRLHISNGYMRETAPVSQDAPAPSNQTEKDVTRAMDRTARRGGMASLTGSQESKARDMERVLAKLRNGGGLVLVNYYIPVELSTSGQANGIEHGVRIPNPASSFRGLGIHLDGSNWLMTAEALADDTVQNFFANVDAYSSFVGKEGESPAHWSTPLRDSEWQKFIEIADRKFTTYIRNISASLIKCIANADDALRMAVDAPEWISKTDKERNKDENYRNNQVRNHIRTADERLASALKAAEAFDATESVSDLLEALRAAISSEREAFNAIAASRGVKAA